MYYSDVLGPGPGANEGGGYSSRCLLSSGRASSAGRRTRLGLCGQIREFDVLWLTDGGGPE